MLTIFACPKPFTDLHIATIQRNAIKSWLSLRPTPEIILIGDEDGTAAICRELGLRHVPDLALTNQGAPRFDDLFLRGQQEATHDLLCYVNADIILMSDFAEAVHHASRWSSRFLATGARWSVEIGTELRLGEPGWEVRLRALVSAVGEHQRLAPDYFLFPRGLFQRIPPLAHGRACWDNWLIWCATRRGVPVVDTTTEVLAVHQNHRSLSELAHLLASKEVAANKKLVGSWVLSYNLEDCTHRMMSGRVHRTLRRHWSNRLRTAWALARAPAYRLLHRTGFRRSQLKRLFSVGHRKI